MNITGLKCYKFISVWIVLEIFEKKSPKPCISMVLGPCDNRLYVRESGKALPMGHLGYIKLNSQCLNLICHSEDS